MPALAAPADVEGLFGSPFTQAAIDIASAGIRSTAGWHIAPEVTETLTLDSDGSTRLLLPTLKLVEVTEVRDVREDTPVVLDGWRMSPAGVLVRTCGGWPCGVQAIEVDVVHGYDSCPPELLPLIAAGCRSQGADSAVKSQTTGPFSVTYRDSAGVDPALARYMLPPRP